MTTEELTVNDYMAQALAAVNTSPLLRDMGDKLKSIYAPESDNFLPLLRGALACAYLDGYKAAVQEVRK